MIKGEDTVLYGGKEMQEKIDTSIPVCEVRLDPDTQKIYFVAYSPLTDLLRLGADVESYLIEKLRDANKLLVRPN